MPKGYMDWRKEFGALLQQAKPPTFPGPVELHLWFDSDDVMIAVKSLEGVARPKHVRADLDNLIGAVMEVLEDQGIIENDRMVLRIVASSAVKEDER
jgi:Holliday junction resolvase RusA-like endonuclease